MGKEYFKWSIDFETGFKTIDDQHHGLINIINDILQQCFCNDKIESKVIVDIYSMLVSYVEKHFSDEELLMKKYNIDKRHIEVHKQVHETFKAEIGHCFSDLIRLENPQNLGEVADYLITWLAYHILNMDKSLVRQIEYIRSNKYLPLDAYMKDKDIVDNSSEPLLKALKSLFYIIYEKNQELVKLNKELESRVNIRTIELQNAYNKLEYIALRDELTGLYNRRYAVSEIGKSIDTWKRYQVVFSVLFIDVDKFKAVNDQFGHECGDVVLKWISKFLKENTRSVDKVCRLGGDEFLVICNHCDLNSATQLSKKLSSDINRLAPDDVKQYWNPSISIGIAEVCETCNTVSEILNRADEAMYKVKNARN